jgi:Predicted SAM-dependent RNA methyltransferase
MRTLAGPTASIAFTNLSSATSASLSTAFSNTNISDSDSASSPAQAQAKCYKQGVLALMKARDIDIPLERVCLLDPKASLALTPSDGDAGKFTWFLFGVRPVPSRPFPSIHIHCSFSLSSFVPSSLSHPPSHFLCSALFWSVGWN